MQNGEPKVHNHSVQNWNDLKYFLAVARHGSTLAAAKALRLSQSTVHRRLDELEKRLGRQLVRRHPNGYRLTELGEEMRAYAERIEDAVAAFERHLSAKNENLTGIVRVTCAEAVGYRLMRSPLLDKFNSQFPGLRVEFVMSDAFIDLAKGEAEIAIRAAAAPPTEQSLVGRKIAELPWAVFGSKLYVERHGQIERLDDMNRHAIIKLDGELSNHPAALWLQSVAPDAKVAARGHNSSTLQLAVKSGAGLAPLPIIVGETESDLVRMSDPIPDLVSHFWLLMHQDFKRTPRVRAFFDFIVGELKFVRSILTNRPR